MCAYAFKQVSFYCISFSKVIYFFHGKKTLEVCVCVSRILSQVVPLFVVKLTVPALCHRQLNSGRG